MLAQCGAILSGLGMRRILFPSEDCHADVDLFVSESNYFKVARYLKYATSWDKVRTV